MFNLPFRKILSAILFILTTVLLFLLVKKLGFEMTETIHVLLFGGIIFSSLFMFALHFTDFEKKVKPIKKDSVPEEQVKSTDENIGNEKQIKLYTEGILLNINKAKELKEFAELLLKNFAKQFSIVQAIVYTINKTDKKYKSIAAYAYFSENINEFAEGDGINGQVALNKKIKLIKDISKGYITVLSGLGSASPGNLLIIPLIYEGETIALIELASFENIPECYAEVYKRINNPISEKFNTLL